MAEQLELPLELTDALKSPKEMVEEFMTAFNASTDPDLWVKLIKEETDEFFVEFEKVDDDSLTVEEKRALGAAVLKEAVDVAYVYLGFVSTAGIDKAAQHLPMALYARVMAVREIMEFACPLEKFLEAFRRVHRSNMSKLGADGKPVRREDGKVLKGPNYAPPQLMDLVKVN